MYIGECPVTGILSARMNIISVLGLMVSNSDLYHNYANYICSTPVHHLEWKFICWAFDICVPVKEKRYIVTLHSVHTFTEDLTACMYNNSF